MGAQLGKLVVGSLNWFSCASSRDNKSNTEYNVLQYI